MTQTIHPTILESNISTLKQSIAKRSKLILKIKYLPSSERLRLNRIHLQETAKLEVLELQLKGIKEGLH